MLIGESRPKLWSVPKQNGLPFMNGFNRRNFELVHFELAVDGSHLNGKLRFLSTGDKSEPRPFVLRLSDTATCQETDWCLSDRQPPILINIDPDREFKILVAWSTHARQWPSGNLLSESICRVAEKKNPPLLKLDSVRCWRDRAWI